MPAAKEVTVTDISMPFMSMVIFMIKWSLASIPAMILIAIAWTVAAGLAAGALGAVGASGS